ncbi:hypothetical protein KQX54_006670 [Cotesia glomerata]|uniref:Uncharacterized protein n=1 Tax=Cotesia glomerata TaxID=32391 RepID=A0AAV7HTF8_COTGL|nr:hypothetical protein KQX54_006670 [Cotesia glomerata]
MGSIELGGPERMGYKVKHKCVTTSDVSWLGELFPHSVPHVCRSTARGLSDLSAWNTSFWWALFQKFGTFSIQSTPSSISRALETGFCLVRKKGSKKVSDQLFRSNFDRRVCR